MEKEHFKIEEVAERTGLTKRTLRYYEDIELINPIRTDTGYRLYTKEDIDMLLRIIDIKNTFGFCLLEIKKLLELERTLKDIFEGRSKDLRLIESSIKTLKEHVNILEKKEQSLIQSKLKCEDSIKILIALDNELKGVDVDEKI